MRRFQRVEVSTTTATLSGTGFIVVVVGFEVRNIE